MAKKNTVKWVEMDRGYARIRRVMRQSGFRGAVVDVGIVGPSATHPRGELTNADLAQLHEFGGPADPETGERNPPERSFIRSTLDENRPANRRFLRKAAETVVYKGADLGQVLDLYGMRLVGQIRQRIASRIPPPLADSTIRRKGSSVPLIDSGELRRAITHVVRGAR